MTPQGLTTCSVNVQRYRDMLQTYIISTLQQRGCLQETIFMQDGALPHIAIPVQHFLRRTFTDACVISRYFPTAWPPRSPDLKPCDFWLLGYLKDNVYRDRLTTVLNLKESIRRHIQNIDDDALRSVVESTIFKMECVLEYDGSHIVHVLQH